MGQFSLLIFPLHVIILIFGNSWLIIPVGYYYYYVLYYYAGEHLTKLGDQSHPSTSSSPHILTKTPEKAEISVHKSSNPKQATAQDERKMQEILNNPEIRNILQDPRVQKLFEILRTDPEKAQR